MKRGVVMGLMLLAILLLAAAITFGQTRTYNGSNNELNTRFGGFQVYGNFRPPMSYSNWSTRDSSGLIWFDSVITKRLSYHNGFVRQQLVDFNWFDSTINTIVTGAGLTDTATAIRKLIDSLYFVQDSINLIIFDELTIINDTIPHLVPYAGATSDLNLGHHNLLTNSVRLSPTPTGTLTNVGQLSWDANDVCLSVPLNSNVTEKIGQEIYVRGRNNTGVQINDGQVVYINDAQGNSPTIALANADSVNTSQVIGVATENIGINSTGFVTVFGNVNGINTSGFNDGDALYLSATNGTLTNAIPAPPHNTVFVGFALNSTNNGRIFVNPSRPLAQDTTMAWNSNKVAPTQRAVKTFVKDTAGVLRTSIATKQNYSDTTTWDATKSYVISQLLGYVPYTGAISNVNLGAYDLTASNVHSDTVMATGSMGLHLHGTGGTGILVGAGGGGNITFDAYPTTTAGDSVLTTNSSGGLLRYDLKGKLATYLLKSDSATYQTKYRSDTARSNLWPAINAKGTGSVTSVATGFGLSGGTITTSGTLIVDTINVPTQYRVDTASRNAHNLANATGTLDTARLVTVATQGTYGDTISRLQISIDRKGRVISITPLTATTATIIVTTNFTTSYTLAATNKLPICVKITAQAGSLTMNAPTGLYEGQQVVFIAKATGSNQTWSWNSAFAPLTNASGTTTTSFPTTISTAAATVVTCQYSATSNKLNLVSVKYNLDP